jgi:Phage tail lysozyme
MSGAGSSNIQVKIGLDDEALSRIPEARKQIDSLQSSSRRAAKGILTLSKSGEAERLSKGMRGVARESLAAFENMGRVMGPLGVITSASSIAGLGALAREWASFGNSLNNSSQRAGVSASRLSQFQVAAQLTGVSAQVATAGMVGLSDAIFNAGTGKNQAAIAAFDKLRINIHGANGKLLTAAQLMPQVAHGLAGIKSPNLQSTLADLLLGGSGDALMPLFRQYDQTMQAAQSTGAGLTPKMVQDAVAANAAWTRFGQDFTGITNRIEDDWSGTTTKMLTATSNWIENNKGLADSFTKVGVGILSLGALKPAAWVMRLLGLGSVVDAAPPVAATMASVAGIIDMVRHASTSATDNFDMTNQDMGKQTPAGVKATADTLRTVMKAHGMPDASIAGIVGNVIAESAADPTRQQVGGPGYGLAQWSPDRQADFKRVMGGDIHGSTAKQQANFIWQELNQPQYATVLKGLMSGKLSPSQSAALVEGGYEKPADLGGPNGIDRRSLYANAWFNGLPSSAGLPSAAGLPKSPPAAAPRLPHPGQTQLAPDGGLWYPPTAAPAKPGPSITGGMQRSATVMGQEIQRLGRLADTIETGPSQPGIQGGSGAPDAVTHTVSGKLDAQIRLSGAPPGTKTSVTTNGDLFAQSGAPKVQASSVGQGMQP